MTRKNVVLVKQHIHSGVRYAPGATLYVAERLADWLVEQGVARFADPNERVSTPRPAPMRMSGPSLKTCCGRR
jgi:hypothetical protein